MRKSAQFLCSLTLISLALSFSGHVAARAEDVVHAVGRIFAADGKTPIAGAMVAVYDDKNRVLQYVRTESDGSYALPLRKGDLHLTKHSGGGVFKAVGNMVSSAGGLVGIPLKAGIKAAAGLANATDPVTRIGIGAASGVAQNLVGVISPRSKNAGNLADRLRPGAIVIKVFAPGVNDAVGVANTYWLEEISGRFNGKDLHAVNAWLDPISLTPAGDPKSSTIGSNYFLFTEARLEPSIVEAGQMAKLSVKFIAPPEPRVQFVIVARNNRNGDIVELVQGQGDYYSATFNVDKRFPMDDQTYAILAYADQESNPGRVRKSEDAIKGSGLFEPSKPYFYDPAIVVSRNRAEVTLTVLKKHKK